MKDHCIGYIYRVYEEESAILQENSPSGVKYVDITKSSCIQSSTVTQIIARYVLKDGNLHNY
jgi:hypothetical protein